MNINLKYAFSQSDLKQPNRQALNFEIVTSNRRNKIHRISPSDRWGGYHVKFLRIEEEGDEKREKGFLSLSFKRLAVIFDRRIFQSRRKPKSASYSHFSLSLSHFRFILFFLFFLAGGGNEDGTYPAPKSPAAKLRKPDTKRLHATSTMRKRRSYLLVSVMLAAETQRTNRRMDWSWHEMHRECIMHTALSLLSHRSLLSSGYNGPYVPEDVQTHPRYTPQSPILMRIVACRMRTGWRIAFSG